MTIWPLYVFLFLAGIGAAQVALWAGKPLCWLAWKIDCWSDHRAFMLCAHAIVAHEFQRGRHIGPSIKYALKIMRGAA